MRGKTIAYRLQNLSLIGYTQIGKTLSLHIIQMHGVFAHQLDINCIVTLSQVCTLRNSAFFRVC